MAPSAIRVIMPVARMILVEIFVQVSERTMIGTVLGVAVEALFMSALVRGREILVKSPVVRVIVVVVVRESRRHSRGQQHNRCRRKDFGHRHATSPLLRARR
jgi:hypothetical protein